ncbi:hypothetical protein [Xenorhabdus anantnagensis]|uniref:Uncharacterized protein n=1 Tax=Xenorhabdus anantnagensis TaxID=3025875 RepID=A0ABT5LTN6_9GAMM|nr:hypothetical protein [Xenorhabdus anantnagensis]MDC9597782.1 hypothetical protein [Xenorhabdus anantnagensis]
MLESKDIHDIDRLITLLKSVIIYLKQLGYEETFCPDLKKSINILENKSINGMGNLHDYIMGEFRMMADRGQYGEEYIDSLTNEISMIVSENSLFNKFNR